MERPVRATGMVWYRREDYQTLRDLFDDGDRLPATWEKWFYRADKLFRELTKSGHLVEKVHLDPAEFPGWCRERGLNIDAHARNRFANEVAYRKHGQTH